MKINKKKLSNKKQKAFIAAYILIATSVAITILSGLLIFATTNLRHSVDEVSRQQALQMAESGVYFYEWYLAHNLDGKDSAQVQDFWESGEALGQTQPLEKAVTDFSNDLYGYYRITVEPPNVGSTSVNVISTGWTAKQPKIKRSVKVRFKRPAWSDYSILGNEVMRFGPDTEIYGAVHSNSGIRFDGVAHNQVTSSVQSYLDPDTSSVKPGVWTGQLNENEIFLAGKEYPAPAVDFDAIIGDLAFMKSQAQKNGTYLDGDEFDLEECYWEKKVKDLVYVCGIEKQALVGYRLKLRTDDKLEVYGVIDYQGNDLHEPKTYKIKRETEPILMDFPANGIVFSLKHLWVEGQINTAKLTIVSADLDSEAQTNIFINENILYTNKDGSDVLGLIAEGSVLIGLYSANDLKIDAALLAQKGKVGRDFYTQSQAESFNKRAKITIYGSIITNQRYGFGWTDGTGYQIKNIYFDNNLLLDAPPFFPGSNSYKMDLWEDL